jgi:uncharacterized protein YqeY
MPSLSERISEATKVAMKAREKERVSALRLIHSEIRKVEIDKRITLDDAGVVTVLNRMLKQRKDSITQFEQAGRNDLALAEQFEVDVIGEFMPKPLEEAELQALIADATAGLTGMQQMGQTMAKLKPLIEGRADMGRVSGLVKAALTRT